MTSQDLFLGETQGIVVAMTGSRDWTDDRIIRDALIFAEQVARPSIFEDKMVLVHGECHLGGADEIAAREAARFNWEVIGEPVNEELDGPWPAAGQKRNRRMLEKHKPKILLAFPLGVSKGTWGCIRIANELKIPVFIFPSP